jgi:hypothetical protein
LLEHNQPHLEKNSGQVYTDYDESEKENVPSVFTGNTRKVPTGSGNLSLAL